MINFAEDLKKYTSFEKKYRLSKSRIQKTFFLARNFPIKYILFQLRRRGFFKLGKTKILYGGWMWVDFSDKEVFSSFFFKKLPNTENALLLYLYSRLKAGDVFYDIGANYGFYSKLAELKGSKISVHSFEPNRHVYELLKKSLSKKACVNNIALGGTDGFIDFYHSNKVGSGKYTTCPETLTDRDSFSKQQIAQLTLDTYVKNNPEPTILKIDVEGAELTVLSGAKKTLSASNPTVIMEIWGGEKGTRFSTPAIDFMNQLGYKSYLINEDGNLTQSAIVPAKVVGDHTNVVFMK